MRRFRILMLPFLLATFVFAPSAHAASSALPPFHGARWKAGTKIRVYSQLGARYNRAVTMAIANYATARTGARISFVRVKRRAQAQVILKTMVDRRLPAGLTSSQGYAGRRTIVTRLNLRLYGFERQTTGYTQDGIRYLPDPYAATMLIAHELAHVVGLDHPRRASMCTVANPAFFRACTDRGDADFWGTNGVRTFSCDFVQAIDAKVLAAKYGGRAKRITGRRLCRMTNGTVYVRPTSPSPAQLGLSASDAPGANPVIRWTPQRDAEIIVSRYDLPCASIADPEQTDHLGVQGPTDDGTVDMSAGVLEDTNVILDEASGEPITTPRTICYRAEVSYGASWGSWFVASTAEATYQP